jgi:hypothetical protein
MLKISLKLPSDDRFEEPAVARGRHAEADTEVELEPIDNVQIRGGRDEMLLALDALQLFPSRS